MQIKPILARLQSALGRDDLLQQMVLLPSAKAAQKTAKTKIINLVVGYNGSPNSQTALDMTLWIAHQTRLATQKQVVVHVVYVLADSTIAIASQSPLPVFLRATTTRPRANKLAKFSLQKTDRSRPTAVLQCPQVPLSDRFVESDCFLPDFKPASSLDHADYVLWQARCLAEEWRGSLEAHLCFGSIAEELHKVAAAVGADLILLGCHTAAHSIVQQLATHAPCQILGIPSQLHPEAAACTY